MENRSKGGDWAWVTHFLSVFFSVVCMGLIVYAVVWVSDLNVAKAVMGFSTGILGVILGFYFNRERLTKESEQKDYFMSQATELDSVRMRLTSALSALRAIVEEEPEEQ